MQSENEKPLFRPNSLLLYKNHPARLQVNGDKLEIELDNGETVRVRPKDVAVLHPGPLHAFSELRPQTGEVQAAWEILAGESTNLTELAELIYGAYTPATAWAAWQQVAEGLFFEGSPENIRARTAEEVTRRKQEREQAEAHHQARKAFLDRIRRGKILPEDREFLREVENLALERSARSMVMRELGRAETPDTAYALLLELGVWNETFNLYPPRLGLTLKQPDLPVPDLPEEERRDLTHLPAFAIDDAGTDTPDDALSLEELPNGWRLWVHVADVAALVTPGSPLDLEGRGRGETLHLPEGAVHLLPREVTAKLGLGLNEISPALSFGIDLKAAGEVIGYEVATTWVRVTRMSYDEAEQVIESEPFRTLERLTNAVRERRRASGAVMIDFPEVKIGVENGRVEIKPLPPLRSRAVVEESMILAGAETARYARENKVPLPFNQQDPADTTDRPVTLSGMFAMRRLLKRGHSMTTPGPHSGLGVPAYAQVTSPLRRYLDLVSHQQLRAFIHGAAMLDEAALLERIGAADAVVGAVRQGELLSEKHWTLVYLLQHPDWKGEGVLVDQRGATGIVLIPALALEVRVHLRGDLPLDTVVPLALTGVNLPLREASFKITK